MTDTLDHHHDDDVRALVRASGADADATHVAELRARVLAAAIGVGAPPRPQRQGEPRRAAMALVGIAAAAVLVVTVALAVRDDPAEIATAPVTTPATTATAPNESTSPSTTSTPPSTGTPVTPTPPPTSTPGLPLGDSPVDVWPGDGTSARLVVPSGVPAADGVGWVLTGDGTLVPLPTEAGQYFWQIAGLGSRIAAFTRSENTFRLWVLDDATANWIEVPLGLGPISGQDLPQMVHVDGSLLIGIDDWLVDADGWYTPGRDQRGVLVRPDLSVRPIALPPGGVEMGWTSVSGRFALLMSRDIGTGDVRPLTQPWMYDTGTDEWVAIPSPSWLACELPDRCWWAGPHEHGDATLEVATPSGVVKQLPDGTMGVFDPDTVTWRRVDDPPVAPLTPKVAVVRGLLLFAPVRDSISGAFGDIAVLDVTSGTWTTESVEVGEDDTEWDLRSVGDIVIVAPLEPSEPTSSGPARVFDAASGTWRAPTEQDQALWRSQATTITLDALGDTGTDAPRGDTGLAVPDGEIRPGVDDLIGTTTGGDLVWFRRDGESVTEQTVLAGGLDASGGDAVVGVLRGTVIYRSGGRLWAVSSPGATPVQVLDRQVDAAALSRDGATLAVLSGVEAGQTLALYPTDGSPPTAGSGGEWRSIVWSPDGGSLYVTSSDSGLTWISRIDVAAGLSPAVTVELYRQRKRILGFDADDRPVTLHQGDEGSSPLMTLDPRTLQPVAGAWDRSIADPMPLASMSPDGTRLALVDWSTSDLTVVSLDGSTSPVVTDVASAAFPIVAG